jgi:rhodanese-related sulfurtransferase
MDAGLPVMFRSRRYLGLLPIRIVRRDKSDKAGGMDSRDAYAHRERYQFVDVRKVFEFEAGHVGGAVHITLQDLPARYEELDSHRPVVVTCQVGQRSALAAEFLADRGFTAHNLEGGLESWVEEGLPLVASEGASGGVVDGNAETLDWGKH